jgi:hypothetical protein
MQILVTDRYADTTQRIKGLVKGADTNDRKFIGTHMSDREHVDRDTDHLHQLFHDHIQT